MTGRVQFHEETFSYARNSPTILDIDSEDTYMLANQFSTMPDQFESEYKLIVCFASFSFVYFSNVSTIIVSLRKTNVTPEEFDSSGHESCSLKKNRFKSHYIHLHF